MAGNVSFLEKKVSFVPAGNLETTPYLTVRHAAKAIEFYKTASGATEILRMDDPNGRVGHAELRIGRGRIMLSDEFPEMGNQSPEALGGSPVMIHLYVKNVDEVVSRAKAAGAKVERPVEDQFYGDRGGKIRDPFGHLWWISTHTEDVPVDELNRRAAQQFGAKAAKAKV